MGLASSHLIISQTHIQPTDKGLYLELSFLAFCAAGFGFFVGSSSKLAGVVWEYGAEHCPY
jgi:hypothetical protein